MGQYCSIDERTMNNLRERGKFTDSEIEDHWELFNKIHPWEFVRKSELKKLIKRDFPESDPEEFVKYVIKAMDYDKDGVVKFEDYMVVRGILLRGTENEKFDYAFQIFDTDKDGFITKLELQKILQAAFAAVGGKCLELLNKNAAEELVDQVFNEVDENKDGRISKQEFFKGADKKLHVKKVVKAFTTPFGSTTTEKSSSITEKSSTSIQQKKVSELDEIAKSRDDGVSMRQIVTIITAPPSGKVRAILEGWSKMKPNNPTQEASTSEETGASSKIVPK